MSYLGLDPTAVRQLAAQMRNTANEIQQMSGQLTSQLGNTQWTGPDHDRFSNDWHSTHMSQLHNVVTALNEAAQQADANANQQEQASNS